MPSNITQGHPSMFQASISKLAQPRGAPDRRARGLREHNTYLSSPILTWMNRLQIVVLKTGLETAMPLATVLPDPSTEQSMRVKDGHSHGHRLVHDCKLEMKHRPTEPLPSMPHLHELCMSYHICTLLAQFTHGHWLESRTPLPDVAHGFCPHQYSPLFGPAPVTSTKYSDASFEVTTKCPACSAVNSAVTVVFNVAIVSAWAATVAIVASAAASRVARLLTLFPVPVSKSPDDFTIPFVAVRLAKCSPSSSENLYVGSLIDPPAVTSMTALHPCVLRKQNKAQSCKRDLGLVRIEMYESTCGFPARVARALPRSSSRRVDIRALPPMLRVAFLQGEQKKHGGGHAPNRSETCTFTPRNSLRITNLQFVQILEITVRWFTPLLLVLDAPAPLTRPH